MERQVGQVLLVRHGQASWGADDYDVLSPTGWEQSRHLGRALAARGVVPALVVRGGMRRHRETWAGMVEGGPALAVAGTAEVDEGWDEFDHVRVMGRHPTPWAERDPEPDEFATWFEEAIGRWTAGRDDGDYAESFVAFGERVQAALRRTAEAAGGGTALVVTSGGPVTWALTSLLGADLDAGSRTHVWRRLNPVCANTSVSQVIAGRRGLTAVGFNDHGHLPADLITYR